MDTSISRHIHAPPELIFRLAGRVEDWPRLLPHYRWVRIIEQRGPAERLVDMAARRDVVGHFGVPLRWTSIQHLDAEHHRIAFEHVAGITCGMRVTWSIAGDQTRPSSSIATIRQTFSPAWPVPATVVRLIVGDYFVNGVAARTLRVLGAVAEARAHVDLVESHGS